MTDTESLLATRAFLAEHTEYIPNFEVDRDGDICCDAEGAEAFGEWILREGWAGSDAWELWQQTEELGRERRERESLGYQWRPENG